MFKIETFGFVQGGRMNISLFDLKITSNAKSHNSNSNSGTAETKIGFVMRKAQSESAAQQDLEKMIEKKGSCIFDNLQVVCTNTVE